MNDNGGDDFSDYPKSVNELKASNADDAAKWTPREAIISVLRDIDSGKRSVHAVVIVTVELKEDGNTVTNYVNAVPNLPTSLGALEIAKFKMLDG